MAGPLTGLGQSSTLPINNSTLGASSNSTQQQPVRDTEQQSQQGTNTIQGENAPVNQSQSSDTTSQDDVFAAQSSFEQTSSSSEEHTRGGNLDILV